MNIQPIESRPGHFGDEVIEAHPAFGTVTVSRKSGGDGVLFGSDVLSGQSITLAIHAAERSRDSRQDRVHATNQLIEIEMTLAQWGSLVSSVGIGSGVPVTLRWLPGGHVPGIPFEPRIEASLKGVDEAADKMLADIEAKVAELGEAIESGAGKKALREAHSRLNSTVRNAKPNVWYLARELNRTAEDIVQQARVDIETQVLEAKRAVGAANVSVPKLTIEEGQQ